MENGFRAMPKKYTPNEKLAAIYSILKTVPANHAMTHQRLLDELKLYGISTNLRSIADYCKVLKEAGLIRQRDQKGSAIGQRGVYGLFEDQHFDLWETKVLSDAVSQIPYIPKSTVEGIREKLLNLTPPDIREAAKHLITDLPDQYYETHDSFIDALKTVLTAITNRKVIKFNYTYLGADKQIVPDTKPPRIVHPYALTIKDQHFYLLGYHEKYRTITPFRVDRITDPVITDKQRTPMARLPIGDMTDKVRGFIRNNTNNFFSESTKYLTIRWHPDVTPVHVLFDVMGDSNVDPLADEYVYRIKTTDNIGLVANLLRLGSAIEILQSPEKDPAMYDYIQTVSKIISYYPDLFAAAPHPMERLEQPEQPE